MLEGVVLQGTGRLVIKNDLYSVAGKTGTAQIAQGSKGYGAKNSHQTSFCGYFPADKPKYSMIVVISDPTEGSHFAAEVSGPVFKEIADRVYSNDLRINQKPQEHLVGNTNPPKVKTGNSKALKQVYTMLGVKPLYADAANTTVDTSNGVNYADVQYKSGTVPTVTGMGLSDALYLLGNAGYRVTVRGSGVVKNQSVTGGSMIPKGSRIALILE
jgi:cell division protein FtsI (penicillin-binding protein 3)